LVKEIERELGGCGTILGGEAGMHLTILIDGIKDQEIAAKAAEQKLWLSALSRSYVSESLRQGFVLGFANSRASQIPGAVRLLRKLLKAQATPSRPSDSFANTSDFYS
jgi:GntR family transcriptional regulator/MocR family aminotransferase